MARPPNILNILSYEADVATSKHTKHNIIAASRNTKNTSLGGRCRGLQKYKKYYLWRPLLRPPQIPNILSVEASICLLYTSDAADE